MAHEVQGLSGRVDHGVESPVIDDIDVISILLSELIEAAPISRKRNSRTEKKKKKKKKKHKKKRAKVEAAAEAEPAELDIAPNLAKVEKQIARQELCSTEGVCLECVALLEDDSPHISSTKLCRVCPSLRLEESPQRPTHTIMRCDCEEDRQAARSRKTIPKPGRLVVHSGEHHLFVRPRDLWPTRNQGQQPNFWTKPRSKGRFKVTAQKFFSIFAPDEQINVCRLAWFLRAHVGCMGVMRTTLTKGCELFLDNSDTAPHDLPLSFRVKQGEPAVPAKVFKRWQTSQDVAHYVAQQLSVPLNQVRLSWGGNKLPLDSPLMLRAPFLAAPLSVGHGMSPNDTIKVRVAVSDLQ